MIYVMSGVNPLKNAYAIITATYPAGSTCTCTKSGKTLTAGNTYGEWAFAVPESGTWVVSCTKNGETATQNVVIGTQHQAEHVELSYYTYIFDKSKQSASTVRSQWTFNSPLTINDGNNYFVFELNEVSAVNRVCYYTQGINLSKYESCEVYGYASANSDANKFGFYTSADTSQSFTASVKMNTTAQSHVLDISNLNGVYYPKFSVNGASGANNKIYCQYMRLR